ncbi:hypothetical protein Tco_1215392 [Tanacetum coccineum]
MATTVVTSTTTPPPYHGATTIPAPYPTQLLPVYIATMPPPYTLTQPLIFQQYPPPSLTTYTSFSRLHFDSQGYPILIGPTGVVYYWEMSQSSNDVLRRASSIARVTGGGKGVADKMPNKVGGDAGDSSRPLAVATGVGEEVGLFECMTDSEFTDKRAKGLCYRCDGKFGPGHRCLMKAL